MYEQLKVEKVCLVFYQVVVGKVSHILMSEFCIAICVQKQILTGYLSFFVQGLLLFSSMAMEQRSKAWEDEASFDQNPRNSFLSTFSTNILKDWSIIFLHQSFKNILLDIFLVISLLFIFNQVLPISHIQDDYKCLRRTLGQWQASYFMCHEFLLSKKS